MITSVAPAKSFGAVDLWTGREGEDNERGENGTRMHLIAHVVVERLGGTAFAGLFIGCDWPRLHARTRTLAGCVLYNVRGPCVTERSGFVIRCKFQAGNYVGQGFRPSHCMNTSSKRTINRTTAL